MIEGEDINFPKRPSAIPWEYFGVALFVSNNDLVDIAHWIVDNDIASRGLYADNNGDAIYHTPQQWRIIARNSVKKTGETLVDDVISQLKMKTARYFFASESDAVEFKLRFG